MQIFLYPPKIYFYILSLFCLVWVLHKAGMLEGAEAYHGDSNMRALYVGEDDPQTWLSVLFFLYPILNPVSTMTWVRKSSGTVASAEK